MKKLTITIALCSITTIIARAQNPNLDLKYGLKLSSTMQYSDDPQPYDNDYFIKTTIWIDPSLSLIIKNRKGNFYELELLDLGINKYVQGYDNLGYYGSYDSRTSSYLALRYQYQQNFLKSKNTRWMPFVSIGVTAGVQHGKYLDGNGYYHYKSTFTNLTYLGYLSPGTSYSITKKLFATFTLPITLFDGVSYFSKNSNSQQPGSNASYEHNIFRSFPRRIAGKFSLGIKL